MPIPATVFLPQPFANSAGAPYKNLIPNTPGSPGVANYQEGFPPVTMQEEVSGGIPPLGQDFNGILYALSTHLVALQAGQLYRYDVNVSTAIGGYPIGTLLESTDGLTVWFNTTAANTGDPDANAAGWVPMFNYGYTTKAGLTGGVVTLTREEARRGVIILAGALASNLQLVLPNTLQNWLIVNTTTGGFTTTAKTAAGTGVTIPQGGYAGPTGVYGDGTNIYPSVAPVSLPIDQAPNPLTIAQRTNAGYLLATYFNQSSALENPAVGAIFVQNTGADGYLRKISIANFEAQLILSNIGGQVAAGQVPVGAVTQYAANILASAALTGVPTTPTAPLGSNDSTVASTAFVQSAVGAGVGRVWQDVNGSRAMNFPFTNSNGYPIEVAFSSLMNNSAGLVQAFCDGVEVGRSSTNTSTGWMSISFQVPAGSTYQINQSGAQLGRTWAELF